MTDEIHQKCKSFFICILITIFFKDVSCIKIKDGGENILLTYKKPKEK